MLKKIPNIDTICILVDIQDFEQQEILGFLKQEKEKALLVAASNASAKHEITIHDFSFQILPNGSQGYAYILHNQGYEVKIAQKRATLEAFYPLQVRISSEYLWSYGLAEAWQKIYAWLTETFGKILRHKIYRIDLCCHISGMDLLTNYENCYKGKFKKKQIHYDGNMPNAITFGSRKNKKIYCRIYNKTLEIQQTKKKLWFREIWKDHELDVENTWNIEFELKSDMLREFNLIQLQDISSHLQDLWRYCTSDFLIKIDNTCTRKERCPINKEWIEVQNAYNKFISTELIKRNKQIDLDAQALIPSIMGHITSYSARIGSLDFAETLDKIGREGKNYFRKKQTNFKEEVENKALLIKQKGEVTNE